MERVFATQIAAGRVAAVWVPFETAWAYRGFFRAFRPTYGLVMEIEIWPRMVFAAKKAGVPLFMCNAQYPSKSILRDSRGMRLRQQVMRGFAGAFVKSQLQADRFAAIGVSNIAITGVWGHAAVPDNIVDLVVSMTRDRVAGLLGDEGVVIADFGAGTYSRQTWRIWRQIKALYEYRGPRAA